MFCNKKKANSVKSFAIEFMTQCYEGGNSVAFEEIFTRAQESGQTIQIFKAVDVNGNQPFQKAAKHGNSDALTWILKKWLQSGWPLDINKVDSEGYTALMHCCLRGYTSGSPEASAKLARTKKDRLACVKILLNYDGMTKADLNFQNDIVKMTALHWAAYNDDLEVVKVLIEAGAKSLFNQKGNTPVDIAAIGKNWEVVRFFFENFKLRYSKTVPLDKLQLFGLSIDQRNGIEDNSNGKMVSNQSSKIKLRASFLPDLHPNSWVTQQNLVVPQIPEEKSVFESDVAVPASKTQDESLVELNKQLDDQKTQSDVNNGIIEVNDDQSAQDVRIVYWATLFGEMEIVKFAVELLKMSPFFNSFRQRNMIHAAVIGGHLEILKYLLSFKYKFQTFSIKDKLQNFNKDDLFRLKFASSNQKLYESSLILIDDLHGNTPLHYAYSFCRTEMKDILKFYQPDQRVQKLIRFKRNSRGQIPREMSHNLKLVDSDDEIPVLDEKQEVLTPGGVPLKFRSRLYQEPDFAFIVQTASIKILQMELESLIELGGVYYEVFDREDHETSLIVLFFDDSLLDTMAEYTKLKVHLKDYDCQVDFKAYARDSFRSFNARQQHSLMLHILYEEVDIDTLRQTGVILDWMHLHNLKEQSKIDATQKQHMKKLIWWFFSGFSVVSVKLLDQVAVYSGEKMAFYIAWLMHYTAFLLFPSFFGIIIFSIQMYQWKEKNANISYTDATDSILNVLFSIFIAIWTTFYVESWKRKQNWLGNRWLVRDYQEISFDRKEFKATLDVDYAIKSTVKVVSSNFCALFIGYAVSIFFMIVLIGIYVGIQFWQNDFSKYKNQPKNGNSDVRLNLTSLNLNNTSKYNLTSIFDFTQTTEVQKDSYNIYMQQVPAVVLTVAILIANGLFTSVAATIVKMQNHRLQITYEESLSSLTYKFTFWNSYIGCFIIAFWERRISKLAQQIGTIMVIKQILNNLIEYATYKIYYAFRIWRCKVTFNKKISVEHDAAKNRELKLRSSVEQQILMQNQKPENLMYYYQEAIIQLGFIAMFANTFPLAPICSLVCNLIEIRIKFNNICTYSRRSTAEGANGIGAWLPIMEFIVIICIPVNCAIIYFTGDGDFEKSGSGSESSLIKWMEAQNEQFWDRSSIILLVIVIEHALILLKVLVSELIGDVPSSVISAEKYRATLKPIAQQKVKEKKQMFQDFLTYEELLELEVKKEKQRQDVLQLKAGEMNIEKEAFKKLCKLVEQENLRMLYREQQNAEVLVIENDNNFDFESTVVLKRGETLLKQMLPEKKELSDKKELPVSIAKSRFSSVIEQRKKSGALKF